MRAENDGTREGEEAEEEARREAVEWDTFTEANRKGEGNTMNRGQGDRREERGSEKTKVQGMKTFTDVFKPHHGLNFMVFSLLFSLVPGDCESVDKFESKKKSEDWAVWK